MRSVIAAVQAACLLLLTAGSAIADSRVQVKLDDAQARAALAILAKENRQQSVSDADWDALFATAGYRRLKKREAEFKRAFSDDDFKAFLRTPKIIAQYRALADTLARWTSADLVQLAQRSFAYLPPGAALHATIYPLIKPKTNSFVYELTTDPAIVLYLNPTVTKDQFGNTVSHELYHVGDSQNCPPPAIAAAESDLRSPQKDVLEWLSAFGEGSAVLAAAGGPDVHPHAVDPQSDRDVWDKAMSRYDADFQSLQTFFTDVLDGKLSGDALTAKGFSFFGDVQGPWYTVGYKMNVTIERAFGRAKLIEAMCDKREYMATYNAAAAQENATGGSALPLWSNRLTSLFQTARAGFIFPYKIISR